MSGSGDWSDRRGMFQRGKELHTPSSPSGKKFHETGSTIANAVRRASTSSNGGGSPLEKTPTGGSTNNNFPTAGSGRRRSSAASGGMFGNLTNQKRGSEDYGERRASQTEMMNSQGVLGGWFNSTFKGHQKPAGGGGGGGGGAAAAGGSQTEAQKRGVME